MIHPSRAGLLLLGLFTAACTIVIPQAAVQQAASSPCCVICDPTPGPTPIVTPTPAVPSPPPTATATPTRTVPAPSPTSPAEAAKPFQATGGRAVIRIDLTNFRVVTGSDGLPLDYYSAATLLWRPPPGGSIKPDTPALELSIRGTVGEQCVTSPCGDKLGLVARWSCNIRHDAGEPDERRHVGEGINYRNRLPIGSFPVFDVTIEWGPDSRRVRVSTEQGSWTARRGVSHPGFGVFYDGIPNPPRGIGWARSPWAINGELPGNTSNGGIATLLSWEKVEPTASLSICP